MNPPSSVDQPELLDHAHRPRDPGRCPRSGVADGAPDPGGLQTPAVEVQGLVFRHPGRVEPALDHVSLTVARGERFGLLGPNGGGKTTLLGVLLGLLPPTTGRVRVLGLDPVEAARRGLLGWVPQKPSFEPRFPISVARVVSEPLRARGLSRADAHDRTQDALRLTGADAFADRRVGRLSGGQLQRALIARAIAGEPDVLALDEPTVGVDRAGQERFVELVRRVCDERGVTMILVSHDLRIVAGCCSRVGWLAGTLHTHGPAGQTSPDRAGGLDPAVVAELMAHDFPGLRVGVRSPDAASSGHASGPGRT